MKALITDVFNNINFELCCRMLEEGNEVIGIDQVKENEEQSNKEEKYMHIGRNANFSFIDGRIDSLSSDTKKSIGDIDVIFQISQKGDKSYYKAKENSDNMNSLIKIAKENTRLVYLSSYEVYGNLFGVVDESTEKKPKTPYGLRLFYEEQIIQEQNDVKYVILRTPEIYGTWNSRQSLNNMKASDVIYIDDVVNALMLAAETTHVHEVFNLTTRSGANSREFRIDGKKAKQLLSFKQTVSLEKGKRMLYNSRNSNKNESKGNL
jgi:UDP-glucose 4-epimerase